MRNGASVQKFELKACSLDELRGGKEGQPGGENQSPSPRSEAVQMPQGPLEWLQSGNHRQDDLSSLVGLLDGHLYGLVLALHWLKWEVQVGDSEEKMFMRYRNRCEQLLTELSHRRPDERVSRMIGVIVQELQSKHRQEFHLLEKLAVFMAPIPPLFLEHCEK